jgi:hypothetical protein
MADEAFALSPISARASLPSEEDYDAISQAFMETSRGRWFLGEYAKRNRNADTRMVLDAVERIEQTISAQKQPPADNGLSEALATIRRAVDRAEATAIAAVGSPAAEEDLAPIRKGARIIREISWRWREIGADGRICDLLDSQVSAIEGACGQIASADPQAALRAAFDLVRAEIAEFSDDKTAPRAADEAAAPAPSTARDQAAAAETMPATSATTEAAISLPDETVLELAKPVEVTDEAVEVTAEVADVAAEAAELATEVADMPAEAADLTVETADVTLEAPDAVPEADAASVADDEALLEMVALEMAAPDPDDAVDSAGSEGHEIQAAAPAAEPMTVAETPEPMAAPAIAAPVQPPLQDSLQASLQPALEPSPHPSLQPSPQPPHQASHQASLGSSLISSGIVRKPPSSQADPLAPIRRMSQAEKIAFFS